MESTVSNIAKQQQQQQQQQTPVLEKEENPPKLPFVTTSDVLNQLNKHLKELSSPEDTLEPRFELQRRLPDGSTVRASPADVAYSDLQSKLQQSATFVAQLEPSDRVIWAESQRQAGNAYFGQGDYTTAMDVYLTCLVVKEDTAEFVKTTLIPVLNNLAQCTLQLSMYKKTIEFCKIALEEMEKYKNIDENAFTVVDLIAQCKIYFKQAKARRLTGQYTRARKDLDMARSCVVSALQDNTKEPSSCKSIDVAPYQQAIQKEQVLLDTAEAEAEKNKLRQKRAMQKFISAGVYHHDTVEEGSLQQCAPKINKDHARRAQLDDQVDEIPVPPRQYSSLRKRKGTQNATFTQKTILQKDQKANYSYWEYYWHVVARVAESLLMMLGDEETREEKEVME